MIDFPASPTPGQRFTAAGATWIWDGAKWLPEGLAPTVAPGINDNRIINGDMRIDQRNNGASGTVVNVNVIDRWIYAASLAGKGTWGRNLNAISVLTATGFGYYLGFQSSSAYTPLAGDYFQFNQPIEADFISDFAWGTASAQAVTLSFWANSSLTGAFSGTVVDYAGTRAYPFSYSLPTANTWTKIAITIPGDTAGAWVMSGNGGAAYVSFDLGSGATFRKPAGAWVAGAYINGANGAVNVVATNAAKFYMTGVKLEIGNVATPYNRQSLAKSMADCQRYYWQGALWNGGYGLAAVTTGVPITCPVTMRAAPTITFPTNINLVNCAAPTSINVNASFFTMGTLVTTTAGFICSASVTASAEL